MIRAYIGLLGEGKTLSMVNDAIDELIEQKRVVSNVPFHFKHKKKDLRCEYYPTAELIGELFRSRETTFLIDEASIVFPAHFWNKLPADFLIKFAQARKYGLNIFYTSQGFNHTVKRLRDLTNEVVRCKKHKTLGMEYYSNIAYDPEYYDKVILNERLEKKYIIRRKFITPAKTRKLYKYYDTYHLITDTAIEDFRENSKIIKESLTNSTKQTNITNKLMNNFGNYPKENLSDYQ